MTPTLSDFVIEEIRVGLVRKRATQADLAQVMGVSQATVARRLTGQQPFKLEELQAVAEFFGVPLSTFLAGAA